MDVENLWDRFNS